MRISEIYESAIEELKDRLPKLKSHSYTTIDKLMQDISVRHKMTGKKLHDLFVHKYGHTPDTWIKKLKNDLSEQGVAESSAQNLSIQQLATISDEALDKAYGYGRSTPGNTFGWQANLMSAAYAKKMIDAGVTDIEKISDAIHKGWNITAQKFVQDPDQFGDTEKLRQAGKLDAKLQQRAKLMKINYAQLDNDEQEKDRVVARALLQALKGQQGVAEEKKRLDPSCWTGYHKEGTKMKGDTRVNNCVPNESVEEGENWSKHNNPRAGGMSQKSVNSYRRSHPGSKIQTAVTTKPSKLKKGSKSAKRRKSFCARMRGMKKHRTGAKTARDPNSNINKSLRRWNCESIEQMQELVMLAEQKIAEAKNLKQQAAIAIAKKKKMSEGEVIPFTKNQQPITPQKKSNLSPLQKRRKLTQRTDNQNVVPINKPSSVSETVDQKDDVQQIKDFIKWSIKTLNIQKPYPKITLSRNTKQAQQGHHTGLHHGDTIWVYIENRNLVDIFRTIFHELVHHKQDQLNMIKDGDSYPGSPIEALADMMAGKYIKIYGKEHPEIFQ